MKEKQYQYEVMTPWAEFQPLPLVGLSPRLSNLEGKTIGLFHSGKIAAEGILIAIEEQLREKFDSVKFSRHGGAHYWMGQPYYREPYQQEWKRRFEDWIRAVDAVILAQGD